jgi:intracellular sulfur oxidation DsrE/DsrF family protein
MVFTAAAQGTEVRKHQVVLQMNVENADSWNQLLGNIRNIQTVFGAENIRIEVVAYGKGINLLVKTNTAFEERLKAAAATGVVLAICQNSMRTRNVKPEDVFPFATPVDSGVAELIRKQEAGWSYIRAGE